LKGRIPESKVDEIKSRVNIVDLISEHVTLKKAGRNFIGLCPFHKEKTPSFTVNSEKQIFYCFGCGEGGNAISFLMKVNHQSFPESIRYLARKSGVVVPDGVITREEKERAGIKEQIIRIHQIAAWYFSKSLLSEAGREARQYLERRGIQESVAREFQLGYAPDGWRHLRDHFEKEKVPLTLAEQAGLIVAKGDGKDSFYDRFRKRLIFPIEDLGGRVIAFGGRIVGDGEPKYLNSPESPIYIKGRYLYGLYKTRDEIRQKGCAILVEGYFDLLSLWNAGVRNVVATLGTALTKEHVDLIRRYTRQVIAVFDPDEAGKKALERSLAIFFEGSIDAKIVILPQGYDPDQYIRSYGKDSFEKVAMDAQSMVDYYIETVIGKVGSFEEKRHSLRDAIPFIVNIGDAIERNLFIKRVSEKLGIDQELLKNEIHRSLKASERTSKDAPNIQQRQKLDGVEVSLIHIMLEYPHNIPEIVREDALNYFMNSELKIFGEMVKESFYREGLGEFNASFLLNRLDSGEIRARLLKKMVDEIPYDEKMANAIMGDTIRHIKRKWYRQEHKAIEVKLERAEEKGDRELCNSLLKEKEKLLKQEKALSS
jgi:DNA primase